MNRVLFVITMLPLAGFMGCGAAQGIKTSQATADQFLAQMKAGELGGAYQLCTKKCKADMTQDALGNYWELVEKNRGAVKDWTLEGTGFQSGTSGSTVTLTYRLDCENGKCKSFRCAAARASAAYRQPHTRSSRS